MNESETEMTSEQRDQRFEEIVDSLEVVSSGDQTRIWYMEPDYRRDFRMGYEFLTDELEYGGEEWESVIPQTHQYLGSVGTDCFEDIYRFLQADGWGQKPWMVNEYLEDLGLSHTSMSVGDVLETEDELAMVDSVGMETLVDDKEGWLEIPEKIAGSLSDGDSTPQPEPDL